MQSRKPIISFLQAFGILLVVMGHSTYGAPETPAWNVCMHTFRMPLFMFLSGFLLRYSYEARNKSLSDTPLYGSNGFIWKKVKRLLVPYVVISSLAFLPKSLLNQYASRPVDVSFPEYVQMLFYPWDNVIVFFWFLPTLFLIFMLVIYGARWLRGLDRPLFHVLLMGAALGLNLFNPLEEVGFLNLSGVVSYFLYFYAGYCVLLPLLLRRLLVRSLASAPAVRASSSLRSRDKPRVADSPVRRTSRLCREGGADGGVRHCALYLFGSPLRASRLPLSRPSVWRVLCDLPFLMVPAGRLATGIAFDYPLALAGRRGAGDDYRRVCPFPAL